MAVTESKSIQATRHDLGQMSPAHSGVGELKLIFFDVTTIAGDANSTIALCNLPAGTFRYLGFLSKVYHGAFGTARTMDIGWDAYTTEAGVDVAADEDGLSSAADVAAAGSFSPIDEVATHPVNQKIFSSREGIRFRAKVEAAAVGAGEEISGWLAFAG